MSKIGRGLSYGIAFCTITVLGHFLYESVLLHMGRGRMPLESWIADAHRYKTARCLQTTGPKVVVIGGSSSLFSVDSSFLASKLGCPVVNCATHVGVPLRFYAADVATWVNEGDIVVYPMEWTGQHDQSADSKLFNGLSIALAFSGVNPAYIETYPFPCRIKLDYEYGFNWLRQISQLPVSVSKNDVDIVRRWENERNCLAAQGYDFRLMTELGDMPATAPVLPEDAYIRDKFGFREVSLDLSDEFVAAFSLLKQRIEERGARLLLTGSNAYWYPEQHSIARLPDLMRSVGIRMLWHPEACCFPHRYYYDSRFHMTRAGARLFTYQLYKEILRSRCEEPPYDEDWPVDVYAEGHGGFSIDTVPYETGVRVSGTRFRVRRKVPGALRGKPLMLSYLLDSHLGTNRVVNEVRDAKGVLPIRERIRDAKTELTVAVPSPTNGLIDIEFDLAKSNVGFERLLIEEDARAVKSGKFDFKDINGSVCPLAGCSPISKSTGLWTCGTNSAFRVLLRPAAEKAVLWFKVSSPVSNNVVTVCSGGKQLCSWEFPVPWKRYQRVVVVPASYIDEWHEVKLSFASERTYNPHKEKGSVDNRDLAVLFEAGGQL